MSSTQIEDELLPQLPPLICLNRRKMILPEMIPAKNLMEKGHEIIRKYSQLEWAPPRKCVKPKPSHPIQVSWTPEIMSFAIKNEDVVHRLRVSNRSARSLYIHCCGLWEEKARLGAGWRCYPRTRFLVAPGLIAEMFIRASPRNESPVPCANAGLQLATGHLRDQVIGYFLVPVDVKFGNYKPPNFGECEE